MSTIESICADCSTPLQGRFCADCGAPASAVASDQVGDLVSEWAGNFLQADRDFRRTLGMLLLRPGELTTHWWAGRRRGLASPIKLITAFLLFSALAALAEHLLAGRAQVDFGAYAQFMAYIATAVIVMVLGFVLPITLPDRSRRTRYQYLVAGLYEGAFVSLLISGSYTVTLVSATISQLLGRTYAILPPMSLLALLVPAHLLMHLKAAYGMTWPGALLRTALMLVCIGLGLIIVLPIAHATRWGGLP
jgi:hypothetical protein